MLNKHHPFSHQQVAVCGEEPWTIPQLDHAGLMGVCDFHYFLEQPYRARDTLPEQNRFARAANGGINEQNS